MRPVAPHFVSWFRFTRSVAVGLVAYAIGLSGGVMIACSGDEGATEDQSIGYSPVPAPSLPPTAPGNGPPPVPTTVPPPMDAGVPDSATPPKDSGAGAVDTGAPRDSAADDAG
jgi:hypothetical protein